MKEINEWREYDHIYKNIIEWLDYVFSRKLLETFEDDQIYSS